jgi:hypothetical protein
MNKDIFLNFKEAEYLVKRYGGHVLGETVQGQKAEIHIVSAFGKPEKPEKPDANFTIVGPQVPESTRSRSRFISRANLSAVLKKAGYDCE